ncbi:MAG: hypothetical protein LLF98_02080 [Clostridium sp.]|uniref:hypothetical protein n=1 Tax=Clostridium sp. TaxID=1506 RepID=UPI0025B9BCD9|nr:hypothetical protein [Clostridium sp.]MCE5220070.1 hypothetical protein [Clostridium sp.]
MQIYELKTKIEEGKSIQDLIEVKQYLSIIEKQLIANKIIDSCIVIDDESNLYKIDYFYKKFTSDVSFLVNYTNLEFSENLIEDYDYLAENVGIEWILNQIPISEVEFILDLVDFELAQIVKLNNSIEGILANKLDKLIDKLPTDKQIKSLSKSLVKDVNKLDVNKIAELKGMFNKQGN